MWSPSRHCLATRAPCGAVLCFRAQISDVQRNITRMRDKMRFIHWNSDGFKASVACVGWRVWRVWRVACVVCGV